ncbi:MAG: putative sigma-54 modulation protein [Candidatus Cloacimonadota bacterium]|jgi:putative sigma-54 modulation protein|nr:putative sigma-54 modulation protein [Candidatus Cloacimonadota bacterium]
MQITITARHFNLTNAIREHIEEEAEKLERYFDHIIDAQFVMDVQNERNTVELIVHIPGNNLTSEATETDMYRAIDNVVEKMEQQIKKLKGKWEDHHRRNKKQENQFVYANLIQKKTPQNTVKIKRMIAEPMLVSDAIDEFEKQKQPYLIFKNIETDRINVLIKKDEEHYKLIQP